MRMNKNVFLIYDNLVKRKIVSLAFITLYLVWCSILQNGLIMKETKIISLSGLQKIRENNKNKKIIFTCGCFDILHVGHVRNLQASAALGDILVVALNSDASVKRLKGPERPIVPQDERAEMLAAYDFVDYVILFDEDTPEKVIRQLRPDVWTKGGDWNAANLPGFDLCKELNIEMKFVSYVDGHSSTKIMNAIKGEEASKPTKQEAAEK